MPRTTLRSARLRLDSLEDRSTPSFGTDGPEFRVNTATAGDQIVPDLAVNAAGDAVAVWQGFNPDSGGTDIYAQRFGPAGQPAGGEILVNADTAGSQSDPHVALDAAGNFVVAWAGAGAPDPDGVYLRAFRADGTPLGGDVWVNTTPVFGFQGTPDVAMAADGRFVVVWAGVVPEGGALSDIGAQRFQLADGAVTPVGGNFAANAGQAGGDQYTPAVALNDAGRYVVAWQGEGGPDPSGSGVYAQRFDFTGPVGPPVWANKDFADQDQVNADVGIDAAGDFAVAWEGAAGTGAADPSGRGIYLQRVTSAGAYAGGNVWVNTTFSAGDQYRPRLAIDAAGNTFVTWFGFGGPDPSGWGVAARRYDPAGSPLGTEFPVNTATANDQIAPAVAVHPTNGDAVLAWASNLQDGSGYGVYAQRYRTNLRPTTTGLSDVLAVEDAPDALIDLAPHFADPDGEPGPLAYTATVSGFPGLLTATVNASNQLVLDYAPNAYGMATVTVRASDGGKAVDASFAVTVLGVNDPPTARPDAYVVSEDATLTRPAAQGVLANDTDPEGDAVTASLFTGPSHGTLTFAADGGFTYTPAANYFGPDRFTYQAADPTGDERVTTVDLTVTPVNDNPAAAADAFTVAPASGANALDVLANDSTAPDGPETLTVTAFTPPAHGTVQITGGGIGLSYTPGPGFLGSDAFTYTVSDGNGGSATAAVSVSAPRNQSPTADDDTAAAVEDGGPVLIDVLTGDTDPDGDALTIALVGAAAHGSVAVVAGQVRYTPNEFYFGPDSFQYFVSDGHGGLDVGTVSVTVAPRHGFYATGTDAGSVGTVRLYHAASGKLLLSFAPYAGFSGGVRVAVGDVTGDGVPDVVTAPGKNLAGGSLVKIFDGAALLANAVTEVGPGVLPFGPTYTEELSLALGRFNADARADILVGSFTALGGPDAVVLDGAQALTGAAVAVGTVTDPFGPAYKGGVRVAAGDVNGDGVLDVIAAQSFNGAKVTAFSGSDFRTVLVTFATGLALKGGVYVSAGDLDGDGRAEIVTGAGSGVGLVSVWRDRSAVDTRAIKVASARPFGSLFAGGVRVAIADVDGDGRLDIAVAPGVGKERRLIALGLNGSALDSLDELRTAEGPFYAGGLFVAAGRV